jgi:hypothetical protein
VADLAGWTEANLVGRIRVLAETLDDQDLIHWLGDSNAPAPPKGRLPDLEIARLEANAVGLIAAARSALERSELDARIEVDRFRTFDAGVGQSYEVRQMVIAAAVSKGKVRFDLVGGVGGGTFHKTQETGLLSAAPTIVCDTVFQDVLASPSTRAQLSRFFPGNTVQGSFSHSEKLTMPLASALANMLDPRAPLRASGSGETTAVSGVMEGRAAPEFVTFLFPGLNTTKYRYNRMRAFSKTRPDGIVENDMIFSGESYDVYMEGTTDADNVARYEMGIILVPMSPEWSHDLGLGRIPIIKIEARIEGGRLLDQKVSYPLPTETAFIIAIRNNPLYRMWVTPQKK